MNLWLITRILCISYCSVALYAFPSNDGNDAVPYLKIFGYLEESADQEILDIRDRDGVSAAIKDPEEISALKGTGELDNETISMMNVIRCGVKNKTRDCVRNKRTVREDDEDDIDDPAHDRDHDTSSLCENASMDTIAQTQDGSTYLFKGDNYWKVLNHNIPEGYPKTISDEWLGLPGNLDASFTFNGRKTYFFKGSQYWRFNNKRMDRGYPKLISQRFRGIPDNVDAALSWRGSSDIYFFKGNKYWLFSFRSEPPVAADYPKSISGKWGSLFGDGIDAAFQWRNRHVYFFKDRQYYRYNVDSSQVDVINPPYPHSTATGWLGCA